MAPNPLRRCLKRGETNAEGKGKEELDLEVGELVEAVEELAEEVAEGDEDDAEGAEGGGGKKGRRDLSDILDIEGMRNNFFPDETVKPLKQRLRTWDMTMELRGFTNVSNEPINFFIDVSMGHMKKGRTPKITLPPKYTMAYDLGKTGPSSSIVMDSPERLLRHHTFRCTYKDLHDHVLKFDVWQISTWSFNTHFGERSMALWDVATRSMAMDLMIKKKLTKKQIDAKNKPYDVLRLSCTIELAEVYDFHMSFDNWTFKLSPNPLFEKYQPQVMRLVVSCPKNRLNAVVKKSSAWDDSDQDVDPCKFFWAHPGKFLFRGTKSALESSAFNIKVFNVINNPVAKATPGVELGAAIFGMKSILDVSVFKGIVKALTKDKDKFIVGELVGNIKTTTLSKGYRNEEPQVKLRPEQMSAGSMASSLDLKMRYLCIRVFKCENLPVADVEEGSSDPLVRILWDGVVQSSMVIPRTLRPVFNTTFYFPVRFFNDNVFKRKKFWDGLLPMELQSKGVVRVEVWDDDEASCDFLGATEVDVHELLDTKQTVIRSLVGGGAKAADEDEDEEDAKPKGKGIEKEHKVRIYEGLKEQLIGSDIKTNGAPLIKFEMYFCPDFPMQIQCDPRMDGEEGGELGKEMDAWFKYFQNDFKNKYQMYFPDSLGCTPVRDFSFAESGKHPQTRSLVPLPAFLCPIVVPEEMGPPYMLLHWIRCIPFDVSTKQRRTFKIPQWRGPRYLLNARIGSPQDHAVLLCCVLLAMKVDAYVCKGLVRGDDGVRREHAWVMTRESKNERPSDPLTVTFWETCTATRYHLPRRFNHEGRDGMHKDDDDPTEEDEADRVKGEGKGDTLETEVPTSRIVENAIDELPALGPSRVKNKNKAADEGAAKGSRDAMMAKMRAKREKMAIAPDKILIQEQNQVYLPYETIEYVFNDKNVWGNLQNEHPGCVYYDFETEWQWRPLLGGGNPVIPIDKDVSIGGALRQHLCDRFADDLVSELCESVRMFRAKNGLDTNFDMNVDLVNMLSDRIDLLEEKSKLDPDLCEDDRHLVDLTARADHYDCSPNVRDKMLYPGYERNQKRAWGKVLKQAKQLDEQFINNFPVKRGMKFKGYPLHFCTSQADRIREVLFDWPVFKEMLEITDDRVHFIVVSKMYPYASGVLSLWFIIGMEVPRGAE